MGDHVFQQEDKKEEEGEEAIEVFLMAEATVASKLKSKVNDLFRRKKVTFDVNRESRESTDESLQSNSPTMADTSAGK